MSNRDIQIFELAKQGLTAAEIAEALRYQVEDVETILLTSPEMVKGLEKAGVAVEISERLDKAFGALEDIAFRELKGLLCEAEKESVKFSCIDLILRQRLGLLTPKNEGGTTNVINFNLRLTQARERREQLEMKNKVVDVETMVKAG